MRIGIYDPYLDTLGGGEKYVLSIASYLAMKNTVNVFWDDDEVLKKAEKKLNIDLGKVSLVKNIFSNKYSFFQKLKATAAYDIMFCVSDGSIPLLFSKKNFLIIQFPIGSNKGKDLKNSFKLQRINRIICYTNFVKKHLERSFSKKIEVLYPPVESLGIGGSKKKNHILSVGRFTKGMNKKKHEVLIDVYRKMIDDGLRDWKLIIIGSHLEQDKYLVEELRKQARNLPVEIIANAPHSLLVEHYKSAKIYWHAAGFGEDLETHPEYAEHFGISTVEAMGAGAVPVVIKAGGQIEIVEDRESGFLWENLKELEDKTLLLISDKKLWREMSAKAEKRAKFFSKEKFYQELEKLI
jgi:glycosyltransferase involved in cell wall biosynthesis